MKIPVSVHVMLGNDTRQTFDGEIEVTVTADQIAAAIADSKGLDSYHICNAVNNMAGFFKDLPDATLKAIELPRRRVIAGWLRTLAGRFDDKPAADTQEAGL